MSCTEEHDEIQRELEELRQVLIRQQQQEAQVVRDTVAEVMTRHESTRHHPPLNAIAQELGKTPTDLMREFIEATTVSSRMVDALDGPLVVRGVSGVRERDHHQGLIGKVDQLSSNQQELIAGQKELKTELRNGIKHKRVWTPAQWVFAGTLVTVLGGILTALLTGG